MCFFIMYVSQHFSLGRCRFGNEIFIGFMYGFTVTIHFECFSSTQLHARNKYWKVFSSCATLCSIFSCEFSRRFYFFFFFCFRIVSLVFSNQNPFAMVVPAHLNAQISTRRLFFPHVISSNRTTQTSDAVSDPYS